MKKVFCLCVFRGRPPTQPETAKMFAATNRVPPEVQEPLLITTATRQRLNNTTLLTSKRLQMVTRKRHVLISEQVVNKFRSAAGGGRNQIRTFRLPIKLLIRRARDGRKHPRPPWKNTFSNQPTEHECGRTYFRIDSFPDN